MKANRNPKYNKRISAVETNAVLIKKGDWKRVKTESVHLTPQEQQEILKLETLEKKKQIDEIQKTREKLINQEIDSKTLNKTHQALESLEEKDYALQIAELKGDEDLDEVKKVNSLMVAARARAFRDEQLRIHQEMKQKEKDDEKRLAREQEENRVKAQTLYKDREAILKEQRIKGRKVIDIQIEEHKINAILEAERRDREQKAMLKQNEIIRQEDDRIKAEQKARKESYLKDYLNASEEIKQRKLQEKEREKEEAQMTIDFQNLKALKEEAREREIRDQKLLKEREIQEIRAKQQRAIDTQALRDEYMASRIQEEKEKSEWEAEQAEKAKQVRMRETIKKDQLEMIETKKKRILDMNQIEQAEYQKMIEAQKAKKQKALEAYNMKVEKEQQYREELAKDVEAREITKVSNPLKKFEEQKRMMTEQEAYRARVERIKARKLEQLRNEGIPEKHLTDIEHLRLDPQ